MPTFLKLRQEHADLSKQTDELFKKADGEGRTLTPEEIGENEKRFARIGEIKRTLDDESKFAALAIAAGTATPGAPVPGQAELEATDVANQFAARPGESADAAYQRHRDAINHFVRTGETRTKQFVLTTSTASGVLLPTVVGPPRLIKRIANPIRAALIARGISTLRTVGTANMKVPVFDDTAVVGEVIAEDLVGETEADPGLAGLTIGATLYASKAIWESNTAIAANDYDFFEWAEPMLAGRIDAAQTAAWVAALAAGTVGKTTAGVGTITYPELLDWQHSIPVPLRGDGVFFLSDGLQRTLRGLVDTTGRPIYQESLRDDAPDRLLGWPVFVSGNLATPAAGAVSGVAASASSLVVREVTGQAGARRISRYQNEPHRRDQTGVEMFENGGFAFLTGGVRTLKHAAS